MLKAAGFILFVGLGAAYLLHCFCGNDKNSLPKLPENTNWGPLNGKKHDSSIRPFEINVSQEIIDDLNIHLARKRRYVAPLEETGWEYGISGTYMKSVVDYWRNKYDWNKRQDLLNKYPQFLTNIQGLDIHFYHVKPNEETARNAKVIPILLVHGWPGSVVEFQKIIPILMTPKAGENFVFELIIPSLPGYGFSDGAVRPGLGPPQMAVIFKNLMNRLGFKKYYVQGGDWGSAITSCMASMFPERILGIHMNMCLVENGQSMLYKLLAMYLPSLIVEPEHASKVYPLKKSYGFLLRESGYLHLQATKPDTIGNALSESPVALATYMLEKFSTWTNPEYVKRDDGGLLEKYTMDELLDNIMIYWVSNSITTSMRIYAENFGASSQWNEMPIHVPTACAAFPSEIAYTPKSLLKLRLKNLTQFNHFSEGGHFAAFEVPNILAGDIWNFVGKLENPKKNNRID